MKAIRWGICALVAFAVLSFGGVQPWGQAVLEIGAASLFVLWGVLALRNRQADIRWNWLYVPLLSLGVLGLAQYAFGLSVYPYLTKIELLRWSAYVLLFFLAEESFRAEDHIREFVWFLISLGFAVSLLAIIQDLTFDGKLYWIVSLPAGASPFGPFVDRDHFAGFVELTAPLGLALLLFRSRRSEQVTLLLLFTIVPIGALILTASRGGIICFALELALLWFLSRTHRIGRKQWVGAAAIALVAGTFIVWLGVGRTVERFEQLTQEGISGEIRVAMYRDTWRIVRDHPAAGTGMGTLVAVYPEYATFYNGLIVDHAHNDYLELLAEGGIVGGLCGLVFVVLVLRNGLTRFAAAQTYSARAITAGSLVACCGLLMHTLVDFNLQIPSNALIFLLVSLVATAEQAPPRPIRPKSRG